MNKSTMLSIKPVQITRRFPILLMLGVALTLSFSQLSWGDPALSDSEIKQILIQRSMDSYSGNCPCPYNTTRSGRRCGKRSAYSRPGGYSPLCYKSDVSDDMIRRYRSQHKH